MRRPGFIRIVCSALLVLLTACGTTQMEQGPGEEFSNYLRKFNLSLNDDQIYFLMPDNQCENCYRYDGSKIDPALNQRLVIISGFPANNFPNFTHVYYDEENTLLELKLLNYGNAWITCRQGTLSRAIPVTDFYKQLDSLGQASH